MAHKDQHGRLRYIAKRMMLTSQLGVASMVALVLSGWTIVSGRAISPTLRFMNSGVTYDIPRNYLAWPSSPEQPNVTATFPDFGPAGEAKGCVTWMDSALDHPCYRFDFLISGGRGPKRREMANNAERGLAVDLKVSNVDEFGFTKWYSRNNPSLVMFRRDGREGLLYFFCNLAEVPNGNIDGPCDDIVFLSDGNSARVLFPYRLRNQLPEIETGIGALMKRFRSAPSGSTEQS